MLRSNKIRLLTVLMMGCIACTNQSAFEQAVKTAVNNQLAIYPQSTLQDLYKNFFQDRFGPGHLIQDAAAAERYLQEELASFDKSAGAYYEISGWKGDYYRVNLSVVKENLIPYDLLLDAFIRSANSAQPISMDAWKKEWQSIDSIIQTMNLSLSNYDEDRQKISDLLQQGKYAVHHSATYDTQYAPHYRIIEKTVFEKELLPLLPK
ncbi:MAG: hypothetical protein LBN71_08540 [Tannerella sp.]|jgi:hypothetical protein|nr:hypothetical protein [Tannerella sp.]